MTPDRVAPGISRWIMCQGSCGGELPPTATTSEWSAFINEEESRKWDWFIHELSHLMDFNRDAVFALARKAREL